MSVWEQIADAPLEAWLLVRTARTRARLEVLRTSHPDADPRTLALMLVRAPRLQAAAVGFAASLAGVLSVPAEESWSAYVALTVVADVAVALGRPLKSARARRQLVEVWREARRLASDAGPVGRAQPGGRALDRALSSRVTRLASLLVPVAAGPVRAAVRERQVRRVAEVALSLYGGVPEAVALLRARR